MNEVIPEGGPNLLGRLWAPRERLKRRSPRNAPDRGSELSPQGKRGRDASFGLECLSWLSNARPGGVRRGSCRLSKGKISVKEGEGLSLAGKGVRPPLLCGKRKLEDPDVESLLLLSDGKRGAGVIPAIVRRVLFRQFLSVRPQKKPSLNRRHPPSQRTSSIKLRSVYAEEGNDIDTK